jgi:hypothetical protein
MAWATFEDVRDRWVGSTIPTDADLVSALILDAEAVILLEYPRIQARIDSGALPAAIVKMVVVRMVTRVLRNPENLTYWQQNTGPFAQGRTFGADRDIWLTSEEEEMLAPNIKGKAYEIDLGANAQSGGQWIWLTGNGYGEESPVPDALSGDLD